MICKDCHFAFLELHPEYDKMMLGWRKCPTCGSTYDVERQKQYAPRTPYSAKDSNLLPDGPTNDEILKKLIEAESDDLG